MYTKYISAKKTREFLNMIKKTLFLLFIYFTFIDAATPWNNNIFKSESQQTTNRINNNVTRRIPTESGIQQSGLPKDPIRPPQPTIEKPRPEIKLNENSGTLMKAYNLSVGGFNLFVKSDSTNGGNAPYFVYWSDKNSTDVTKIQFSGLYQTNKNNTERFNRIYCGNGAYDWHFSEITDNSTSEGGISDPSTSQYTFTITGYPTNQGEIPRSKKPKIIFISRLISNPTNGTEFKFDFILTDFQESGWRSDATQIVSYYKVEKLFIPLGGLTKPPYWEERPNLLKMSQVRLQKESSRPSRPMTNETMKGKVTSMEFGGGSGMDSNQTACSYPQGIRNETNKMICNLTVNTWMEWGEVGSFLKSGDNQYRTPHPFVLISYPRFNQTMKHDPTMYTQSTSSSSIKVEASQILYNDTGSVIYENGAVTSNWIDPDIIVMDNSNNINSSDASHLSFMSLSVGMLLSILSILIV
jgi:hypothetical protein